MNQSFLENHINDQLIQIIMSNPRNKQVPYKKIIVKPFIKNEVLQFQFESFTATQAFHENYDTAQTVTKLLELIKSNNYKQIDGFTSTQKWHALFNKKGQSTLKLLVNDLNTTIDLRHNRQKEYLFKENQPVAFLVELGIMTADGRIVKKRYDKFKQINRFVEMVDDVIDHLPTDRRLRIIDFGCGRSYLTFALYHYLVYVKKQPVTILGLDLKSKVISDCNLLAKKCHYKDLQFKEGDIVDYESVEDIDMVVTLHACNTATDIALQKAVQWNAKVILSVPCCQHELNQQIVCDDLKDLLGYGIIKERVSALFTDAMRANWLKLNGYDVQILEFIDVTHTPKNLLIRGIKVKEVTPTDIDFNSFDQLQDYLNADLTIRHHK